MSQVILFILIRLTSIIITFLVNRKFCWCCTIVTDSKNTLWHSTKLVLLSPTVPLINITNDRGCRSSRSSRFHPSLPKEGSPASQRNLASHCAPQSWAPASWPVPSPILFRRGFDFPAWDPNPRSSELSPLWLPAHSPLSQELNV